MRRADTPTPNEQGLCASCFYRLDGDKVWWSDAYFHARCAARHEALILGDDAHGLAGHLDYLDDLDTFIRRFATEAAQLGLDRARLETAIARAIA